MNDQHWSMLEKLKWILGGVVMLALYGGLTSNADAGNPSYCRHPNPSEETLDYCESIGIARFCFRPDLPGETQRYCDKKRFRDVLFPNDNKDIDTATLQHSFVVEVLTNYAKPLVPIDVAGEQVQTYGQASDGVMSQYAKDQEEIAAQAISCMKSKLARNPTRPALVLDIDETSLSNLWKILQEPFLAATTAAGTEARNTGDEPAVEATLKLYDEAIANDVAVFFISGRTESQRDVTQDNLKSAGFWTWEKLVTTVDGTEPAGPYKTAEREKIRQEGWTIITNVGDQFSDLDGADGKPDAPCAFKLPNPYYEIPWSDRLIALDITVLPGGTVDEQAVDSNLLLVDAFPDGFRFGSKFYPHVSLLQMFASTSDLQEVEDAVGEVIAAFNPSAEDLSLISTGVEQGEAIPDSSPPLFAPTLTVTKTHALSELQNRLVGALTPFMKSGGTAEAFLVEPADVVSADKLGLPPILPVGIQLVENYVSDSTGANFSPHITLGLANNAAWQKLLERPFSPATSPSAAVAVCWLGPYDSCHRIERRWRIKRRWWR